MTNPKTSRPASSSALLLLAALVGSPAAGQGLLLSTDPMEQARAAMARSDPAEALSRYLRVLAARPRDMEALVGAGRAALEIGDPGAAIGFFARAEEIEPRNGRVKAGLGSAMLQMENAKAALKLFDEATDLGVPPAEIAGDRGLAHDLRGDNRRAQQDYLLALRTADRGETRRRLALSLAITGDRIGALAILDPLLRKQDVPAWRARAFVLALTGDTQGAQDVALKLMPKPQADALLPFLARLRTLKPQQQAAAVHFGRFPSDGRRYTDAELFADASPLKPPLTPRADIGLIPSGQPLGRGAGTNSSSAETIEPISSAPRRRPGSAEERSAAQSPVAQSPAAKPSAVPAPGESARMRDIAAVLRALPASAPAQPVPPQPVPAAVPSSPPPASPTSAPPRPAPQLPADPGFVLAPGKPVRTGLSEATGARPKTDTAGKAADKVKDGQPKDAGKADVKESAKAKDRKAAEKSSPERHWVQVAGGANKADLPKAYARLKEKSPKLFAGRGAWTTPLRATNRLLVGPFKTLAEAQAFVNTAGKESISAFTYTSPAGQDVEKLAAK